MTTPQAFQGDYTGLKFVNTRKVAQVVIEIPLEQATAFVAAFGTPDPANGVPLAIARINNILGVKTDKPEPEKKRGGKLAQRAGILCNEGGFIKFLGEKHFAGISDPADAADMVRGLCGVNSRADLDHNDEAALIFRDLEANYNAWLRVAA